MAVLDSDVGYAYTALYGRPADFLVLADLGGVDFGGIAALSADSLRPLGRRQPRARAPQQEPIFGREQEVRKPSLGGRWRAAGVKDEESLPLGEGGRFACESVG